MNRPCKHPVVKVDGWGVHVCQQCGEHVVVTLFSEEWDNLMSRVRDAELWDKMDAHMKRTHSD